MPLVGIVPSQWHGLVLRPTKKGVVRVNRISYEVCVFQLLREQLRSRAVWVQGAYRYRNPDDDLPTRFQREETDLLRRAGTTTGGRDVHR